MEVSRRPRCVPAEPRFASLAERVVSGWLLDQLPADAVVIHGLRLSDRRQDREADLVVALPGLGIAVIEVKGGHVALDGAAWTQTSQAGLTTSIDPVGQARSCKYLLRDYLRRHPAWPHRDPRMVHLLAFPFTEVPGDFTAPGCPRWMVIAKDDREIAAARLMDALRSAEGAPGPPTAAQVADFLACVAGRMLPQRDVLSMVADHEQVCDLLTVDQARVLDLVRLLHRVEVRGAAGSGKTWLAIEQARRPPPPGNGSAWSATAAAWPPTSGGGRPRCPTVSAPPMPERSTDSGWTGSARPPEATTTADSGSGSCPGPWPPSPPGGGSRIASTPSSSTRRRTSPTPGGRPCWRR